MASVCRSMGEHPLAGVRRAIRGEDRVGRRRGARDRAGRSGRERNGETNSVGRGEGRAAGVSSVTRERGVPATGFRAAIIVRSPMASAAEILAAFRELSNAKQLEKAELYGLLQDGILAALAKKYGPT